MFENHEGVSIREAKQTEMMAIHQNIPSIVILKIYKLANGNVRFQLAAPDLCETRNSSIISRNMDLLSFAMILFLEINFSLNLFCKQLCKEIVCVMHKLARNFLFDYLKIGYVMKGALSGTACELIRIH